MPRGRSRPSIHFTPFVSTAFRTAIAGSPFAASCPCAHAAAAIHAARRRGWRIVCVGTTSVRTLETVATEDGVVHPGSGFTQIFITPGVKIKAVDALITNFHLPQSTLLMLISALMGREEALRTYEIAVKERYRFFSFGDAMMILDK